MTTAASAPPATAAVAGGPSRRRAAMLLALRLYLRELRRDPWLATGSLALPALGQIGVVYVPSLIIGALVGHLAAGAAVTAALVTCAA